MSSPIAKKKAGKVKMAVWKNEFTPQGGQPITSLSFTFQKPYKDRTTIL